MPNRKWLLFTYESPILGNKTYILDKHHFRGEAWENSRFLSPI